MPRRPPPPPVDVEVAEDHSYLFAEGSSRLSQSWWWDAGCREAEPEVFFPLSRNDQLSRRIAAQFCSQCPVRVRCLEFALEDRSLVGIWGGTDEEERRAIRSQSAATGALDVSLRMISL